MSIYISSDHRGVELKNYLVKKLSSISSVISSSIKNTPEDDYPDFAFDVCSKMSLTEDLAILICGNGIGISIAANKVKGIRCGRVLTLDDALASKEHNYANAISLPADMSPALAYNICLNFINASPSKEDRHLRRVNKIIAYENGEYNEL